MGCCFSLYDTIVESDNKETNKYTYVFESKQTSDDSSNPYIIDQKSIFF